MATTVLGLKTFAASDPVDYNEINDNYNKIDTGVKTALQGRAAQNLLDNSCFANFVNQRGGTATAGTWNYCIDRWRAIGTAGQLVWHNSDHVALGALRGISQAIENKSRFVWKTYTLAAKDIDGVLYITSGIYGGDNQHIWKETNGMELRLYSVSDDNNIYFWLKNLSSDTSKFIYLKWAALYEGSYTADTLPDYQNKGYAAELAECQRYYYQTWTGSSPVTTAGMKTVEAYSNYGTAMIDLPQEMRVSPTIVVYDAKDGTTNQVREWVNDTIITLNSATVNYRSNKRFGLAGGGNFTKNEHYYFHYSASADL